MIQSEKERRIRGRWNKGAQGRGKKKRWEPKNAFLARGHYRVVCPPLWAANKGSGGTVSFFEITRRLTGSKLLWEKRFFRLSACRAVAIPAFVEESISALMINGVFFFLI